MTATATAFCDRYDALCRAWEGRLQELLGQGIAAGSPEMDVAKQNWLASKVSEIDDMRSLSRIAKKEKKERRGH